MKTMNFKAGNIKARNFKAGLVALAMAAASIAGAAHAGVTIVVPGTADPFLAGAAGTNGYVTFGGAGPDGNTDYASPSNPVSPGVAEVPVPIAVTAGQTLNLNVTYGAAGQVGNCGGCFGGYNVGAASPQAVGFTPLVTGFDNYPGGLPLNDLIGLFSNGTPGAFQIFDIGAVGDYSIVVPTGATTLYLATADAYQWNNNVGAYAVQIAGVPEPATWAMLILGVGMVGFALRRRPSMPPVVA